VGPFLVALLVALLVAILVAVSAAVSTVVSTVVSAAAAFFAVAFALALAARAFLVVVPSMVPVPPMVSLASHHVVVGQSSGIGQDGPNASVFILAEIQFSLFTAPPFHRRQSWRFKKKKIEWCEVLDPLNK
jgi:hypothetical protein